MGAYIYTMRKRKVRLHIPDFGIQQAHLFSYAYKPWNSFNVSPQIRRTEARFDRLAEDAWETYEGGFVVVGDLDKGQRGLAGAYVYTDVKVSAWRDSGEFPGTPVGIVKVETGNTLLVVTETEWEKWRGTDREARMVVRNGMFRQEVRCTHDHYPVFPKVTVDDRGNRLYDLETAKELYQQHLELEKEQHVATG